MNKRRFVAFFLAVLSVLIPMLTTACGKEEKPEVPDTPEESNKILSPAFGDEHLKFDNEDFVVLTKTDGARENGYNVVDLVVEENLGDSVIIDSVLRRNDAILSNFDINIKRVTSASPKADASLAIEKQDYSYDSFMLSVTDGLTIALQGTLVDFSEANYIDFTNPWWDRGVIDNLTLLGGTYIALGDLNTVDNDASWCTLFNKDILAAYGTTDAQMYQMVKEGMGVQGGWTVDQLTYIAKSSYKEDPNYHNKWELTYGGSGTYGLCTQKELGYTLMQAAGITPTKVDSGMAGIVSNLNSQEFQDGIDAAFDFLGNKTSADWYLEMDSVSFDDKWRLIARGGFMANKYAFFVCPVMSINLIREMKSDFGIIPLPKLVDTQEDYGNTLQYYNALCYVVPYRMDEDLNDKSCYVLEAMSYYSSPEFDEEGCLSYAYYTLLLQAKATRDDDAWDMMDIIFGNRVFDLAVALNLLSIRTVLNDCTTGAMNNWASQRDSRLHNLNSEIAGKLEILAKG